MRVNCHPERRAKPGVEGSSHLWSAVQMVCAKILRLASLAQNDKLCAVSQIRLVYREIATPWRARDDMLVLSFRKSSEPP